MKNSKVKFSKDPDDFYENLKEKIELYFKSNGLTRYGNRKIYSKAVVIFPVYFITYYTLFLLPNTWFSLINYMLLGALMIVIGINFGHDAIHNSISANKKINTLFKYSFEIVGASSYAWQQRHTLGHHVYPNIRSKDPDTTQSKIVRIYANSKWKPYHRFQFIYIPFLYLIYSLNWIFLRDFTDVLTAKGSEYLSRDKRKKILVMFIVFKLLYLSAFFILPLTFSSLSPTKIIVGFFLMHACASACLTIALVPSHLTENSTFPEPDKNGKMEDSWAHHQVIVTNDYATKNRFVTYIFGAFNHHIVHHLFPSICHVHYKSLTPIVKETILEFGLPYNYQKSITKSYVSHFRFLMRLGKKPKKNS